MASEQFYKISNGYPVLDVGKLRHPITIQQFSSSSPPTIDASGEVLSWNPFLTAMAAIDAVRGTDVIKGGMTTTQLFLTVVTWWQPGLAPNLRVVKDVDGSTYVIQSVENVLEMGVVAVLNCLALGSSNL